MRFLIHGAIHPDAQAALARHEHIAHALLELSADTDAPTQAAENPALLLPLLDKHQWNLATTESDFVNAIYEHKLSFKGLIILILDNPDELHDQGQAIERLFTRYKRLTPGRLYTVTPARVKIRQLPGI